jgi:hypothetical protein
MAVEFDRGTSSENDHRRHSTARRIDHRGIWTIGGRLSSNLEFDRSVRGRRSNRVRAIANKTELGFHSRIPRATDLHAPLSVWRSSACLSLSVIQYVYQYV